MSYLDTLTEAGYNVTDLRVSAALRLLDCLDSIEETGPRHEAVDLFHRLALHENLPLTRAVEESYDPAQLALWQRYALERFPRHLFYDLPPAIRDLSTMWRYSTREHLISDILKTGSIMAVTLFSLLLAPKRVLEMGVDCGWTQLLFSRLNPEAEVFGVDRFRRCRDKPLPTGYIPMVHQCTNVTMLYGNSWECVLPNVDLCLIDGDHTGDAPYLDSWRAWHNRNKDGEWAIIWDDYHITNGDVVSGVNRFCHEVGYRLQKLNAWFWIGSQEIDEATFKARYS